MRKIYYVNLGMCGGESLPPEFDLEEFCEVLQGKVPDDVEIVAVTDHSPGGINRDPWLVSEGAFRDALGEYCHR